MKTMLSNHKSQANPLPSAHELRTLEAYGRHAHELAGMYEASAREVMQAHMGVHFARGWKVLECGCGSGADAASLLAQGVDIYPTDGCPSMLVEAGRYHPERALRLTPLQLPCILPYKDAFFDGIVATAVLMHLSRESLEMVAEEFARVLRPAGFLYVVIIPEREDLSAAGLDPLERHFNRLSLAEIAKVFRRHRLLLESGRQIPDALGRTTVVIEEGVFRRSVSMPKPEEVPPVAVSWNRAEINGTLPRFSHLFPPLEVELEKPYHSEREMDRITLTSDLDVSLLPTLGCFVPGYSLAVPSRPAFSFAELEPEELKIFSSTLNRWRAILAQVMGEVAIAEHGSSRECAQTAACVAQAHLHLIPLPGLIDELRKRYYQAGGEPDGTFHNLSELRETISDEPYVLFSPSQDIFEVWLGTENFRRQFIRSQSAELLGIPDLYNWKVHPFVEQMELTSGLLRQVFTGLRERAPVSDEPNFRWESPYEMPNNDDPMANPHVVLFRERNVERLLFYAGCRIHGVAEEALDQLTNLKQTGVLDRLQQVRASAVAFSVLRAHFDTCSNRAAFELLQVLGCEPAILDRLRETMYVESDD